MALTPCLGLGDVPWDLAEAVVEAAPAASLSKAAA
jgi:hypothetical protein